LVFLSSSGSTTVAGARSSSREVVGVLMPTASSSDLRFSSGVWAMVVVGTGVVVVAAA
jgi:hypothetical protein